MALPDYVSAMVRTKSLTCSAPTCMLPSQVATAVENWKTAIREAQTFSRMHVLLGMLDASIKWDMSAENARCKVCRKKGRGSPGVIRGVCITYRRLFTSVIQTGSSF